MNLAHRTLINQIFNILGVVQLSVFALWWVFSLTHPWQLICAGIIIYAACFFTGRILSWDIISLSESAREDNNSTEDDEFRHYRNAPNNADDGMYSQYGEEHRTELPPDMNKEKTL